MGFEFGKQDQETNVQTGMTSSVDAAAGAVLEQLKNPVDGNAAQAASDSSTNGMPAGYYSVYTASLKGDKGKKVQGKKVGGRFFFPAADLDEVATKQIKALVSKGYATYESDDATE